MAKRRRPEKRESPPEPAAADTLLRAGEEDGRSGFRLSQQRRTRRRERRGEKEADEGEATSLPGPCAAHDAGAPEDENGEEEAVAAAPHAHTATASPPPGSARRAAAAARHAGSEGWCRRPRGLGRWAGPVCGGGVERGGADRRPPRPPCPQAPGRCRGLGTAVTNPGTGDLHYRGHTLFSQKLPGKHRIPGGRAVRCKCASNQRPAVSGGWCPGVRAHIGVPLHSRAPAFPLSRGENVKIVGSRGGYPPFQPPP
nr:translation initiation factor IF-2-like [Saimiri boliviensis boliviensis]